MFRGVGGNAGGFSGDGFDANRRDIRREQSSDGVFVLSFEDAANRAGERDCD